ncbi:hypothetical protein VKT23_001043 [Stygiomarasmius scandens]|uniref:Leucine-rich repeat domain, L domain-containing protein n=1 Tax=Marasmiellus scandens TaxID=2682957 RepID=A0ABR1KBA6_9AGAR
MDLPLLEHLSMTSQLYPEDDEKEKLADISLNLLPSSTRIKTLRLQSTGVSFFQLPTTENVTTLHLKQHCPWVQDCFYLDVLLRSFPSLIHLSLIGDFVRPSVDHMMCTPNLRSLRVSNSKTISNLLLSLSAPNLTSLTLKNLTLTSLQLFQSLYKPWEKDKFPSLQTLVLICPRLSTKTLKRLFSDFAGVTRLDLINCYGDEVLTLLSEKNTELEMIGFQVPLLLPELETISLHHLEDVEHSLVRFLVTRTRVIPKLRLHSNIQSGVFSILGKGVCIQRWDVLEFWPATLESESEYRVFEDEYDWSMRILTKPPIERDVPLYPPWVPPPEKDEVGWWKKFVSLMKEGFALCF